MPIKQTFLTLSAASVLTFGFAACGDDKDTSSASTEHTPSENVKPAAEVADLSNGVDTQVTLDAGFVEALGTLKLTPAPIGTAEITKAGVAKFPITGGNVKYYTPGSVSPYVQGEIDHVGSGLSLTADGGRKVELQDFVVDPGTPTLTATATVAGTVRVP